MKFEVHPDAYRIRRDPKIRDLEGVIRDEYRKLGSIHGAGAFMGGGTVASATYCPFPQDHRNCADPDRLPAIWNQSHVQFATEDLRRLLGIGRDTEYECWIRIDGLWCRAAGSDLILHIPFEGATAHEILASHETAPDDPDFTCQGFRRAFRCEIPSIDESPEPPETEPAERAIRKRWSPATVNLVQLFRRAFSRKAAGGTEDGKT